MAYLSSLEQCADTLEQCNENRYDLTTASDINKAQNLISKEAVPFLFRQVDQLETAIEAIRAAHESLGQKVEDQQAEYQRLIEDESSMAELQKTLKAEQAALSDEQTNLLNTKSLVAAKERDLAELNRARSATRQKNSLLEDAGKVDAEIIRIRRMIADIEHETAAIPTDDQIQDTQDGSDNYLVLQKLREQLALVPESAVDEQMGEFIDNAMDTLELLENKVFVPWWDSNASVQTERMGFITRLLRYFYKDHGSTMQAIVETLLDHQSMTVDDLRRELSSTGHATNELPLLIGHLKTIGAVISDTTTVAGKQIMTVQLDFDGLIETEDAQQA
ncbi:hypothetical protein IWW55_003179 [Coemansia sp. RSA 2706]|nr:hypothetical protein IWW55_003179 [Coemansia sp. RSA 2706]